MTNPIRVALVTPSLSMGGAERHIVKLAASLDPAQVELSVVILFRGERNELRDLLPRFVSVVEGPYGRRDPRTITWLARVFRSRRIEVAHSFLWSADLFTAAAVRLSRGTIFIGSERGDRGVLSPFRRVLDRLVTFPAAALFCANSRFGADLLASHGCPPEKVRVIHNGIPLDQFDSHPPLDLHRRFGWPEGAPIVGTVSRLVDCKSVDALVRAFALLEQSVSAGCVIVGDGPERPRLEKLSRELGISRISFAGAQRTPEEWIKAFDVFVLATNTSEHCSNSILEAMAAGKPVVATRVGGNPELVLDSQTGVLFEPNDHAALALALRTLIEDGPRLVAMGRSARARIERDFGMATVAERHLDLWRSSLVARTSPRESQRTQQSAT